MILEPYELRQIQGNTWCMMGHQLFPIYLTDPAHCVLLDCGTALEKQRGRIELTLSAHGLTPVGVLCTHSHYDHSGNAAYFQKKYQIPVGMPMGEAEQCRTIAAIKSYLYIFTVQQIYDDPTLQMLPCQVDQIIRFRETSVHFCGVDFQVVHTPGHSIDHVSYITPDNVCYAGDALMCGPTLKASKLPYAHHMGTYLDSVERLRNSQADCMIIAHGGVVYPPYDEVIDANLEAPLNSLAQVRAIVDHPMTMDEIFSAVQKKLEIGVTTVEKAQSLDRFLRPYLEWMVDEGSHKLTLKEGVLAYAPADHFGSKG